jgi:hypothetical protein
LKKLFFVFSILGLLLVSVPVFAVQNGQGGQGTGGTQQGSTSTTGSQVQNQNQVQTQNQGEAQQIQVNNQEQEALNQGQTSRAESGTKSASPRSQVAAEKMSNVAKKVEELLISEGTQDGIGEQVKQIAQEQKQSQDQTQIELGKVDQRGGALKFLIGPDYKALKNMQKQMEQNRLRIQQLEQLQNELVNQGEAVIVQEMIKALTEQNTALQDRINLEEKSGSLFGWFFKLFIK